MTERPSTTDGDYDEIDWDDPASLRFTIPPDPNRPPGWPATIPTDFIYDPETDSYYAPGNEPGLPSNFDEDALMRRIEAAIEEARREPPIPPEDLKIDWAPNKSRARRKSPAPNGDSRQRTLFSDEDEQQSAASDPADDELANQGP